MQIPWSSRKKALLIVDVQAAFLNKTSREVVKQIQNLIEQAEYDFFVECVFHAEKDSLWDKQTDWYAPKDKNTKTVQEILKTLPRQNLLHIEKQTKSAFKGTPDLNQELKIRQIEETHIVGLDANDCVLASALESFDLGYFTYVIEECAGSSSSQDLKNESFKVLRHLNLTNNSCIEITTFKTV